MTITNTDLTDIQWIQASLPVRNGGLGVRRVSSLAPAVFLASAVGTQNATHDLQELILTKCDAVVDSAADPIMFQWKIIHGQPAVPLPNGPLAAKQREWDKPYIADNFLPI